VGIVGLPHRGRRPLDDPPRRVAGPVDRQVDPFGWSDPAAGSRRQRAQVEQSRHRRGLDVRLLFGRGDRQQHAAPVQLARLRAARQRHDACGLRQWERHRAVPEDTTSPYAISWNTTTSTSASHSLTAVARDTAGNTATATTISVTVDNRETTPPTIVARTPAPGATGVATATAIRATFSEAMNASTITGTTFVRRNAANALVPPPSATTPQRWPQR
jgi:hypothetical protein